MQKLSSNSSFSRSLLGTRPTEKENNSINSNTNALDTKTYNLIKYKKQNSQITTTYTENLTNEASFHKNNRQNNKSFIQSSENTKINLINKSQEIISKELKKNSLVEKVKKNNEKIERKLPKATILVVRDNSSFINNVPTSKPTTNITYYDNFIKKIKNEQSSFNIQKEDKPSSSSNFFPSILENLQLSNCATQPSDLNISYNEAENAKLSKYYAKEIMDVLIEKDVKVLFFFHFFTFYLFIL